MKAAAVIPAAGLGRRFGGRKQFQLLDGKPILVHTLEAFERSPSVGSVCVAVPESEIAAVRALVSGTLKKPIQIVAGGKERQDSVRLGFAALGLCDVVVVHDGVRPLVTPEIIEKTIEGALECGGCIAALPAKETIKRVSKEGFVQETVDRGDLWSIQTPQAFRYEIFKNAVERSIQSGFLGTDEAMLVERVDFTQKIKVVTGDPLNIKITSPEDLGVAEALLRMRHS